jgi:hypothetical protein
MANVDTKIYDALKDKEFTIENVLKIIRGLLVEEVEQMEKQRANISNKASKANSQDVVKDNTSVTIKELDFLRNRVISEYYNGNVTKDEREMLCTYFGMLNRLQIKGRSNPYNTEFGVDDIQYPFNNTITELLRMSNDEFTKFRETMMMMFNTISIVKSSLPKKY